MDSVELRKDVYAHFGAAMYYAQCLEQSIIIAIMFIDHFPKAIKKYTSQHLWENDFDRFMNDISSKTMGRLINSLKAVDFPIDKVEVQLKDALDKRNFLAHHYFVERAIEIITDAGCIKMVEELIDIQAFFSSLETEINQVTDAVSLKYGFTKELQDSMMKEMMIEYHQAR